jgi:hypothetical protein
MPEVFEHLRVYFSGTTELMSMNVEAILNSYCMKVKIKVLLIDLYLYSPYAQLVKRRKYEDYSESNVCLFYAINVGAGESSRM